MTTNSVTFGFAGTAGDTAKLQCSLDGSAYSDCVWPKTFTGLADGGHTVAFRAIDVTGHLDPTPASRSFTVSAATVTPPPPPPPVAPSNAFTLPKSGVAKVKKGTLTVLVTFPGVGQWQLSAGPLVKSTTTSVTAAGKAKVTIAPSKKGLKKLKAKLAAAKKKSKKVGSLKVTVKVTFTPTGGAANTQTQAYTLTLK